MSLGLFGPIAATLAVLALAVLLTRLWVADTASHAVRQLQLLGLRPGRVYKLGGAWVLVAVRDRRNMVWGILALAAWVAAAVSVPFAGG